MTVAEVVAKDVRKLMHDIRGCMHGLQLCMSALDTPLSLADKAEFLADIVNATNRMDGLMARLEQLPDKLDER